MRCAVWSPDPMATDPPGVDPMDAIKQTFFEECEEQLAELESGLLLIEGGGAEPDTVNAVFRAVHSIKGGAGAFGLEALVRFAHVFETALDRLRSDQLAPDPPVLHVMLRAADCLADLVRATQAGGAIDSGRSDAVGVDLAALGGGAPEEEDVEDFDFVVVPFSADAPVADDPMADDPVAYDPVADDPAVDAVPGEPCWVLTLRPHAAMYAKANDVALLLRELSRLGSLDVQLDASCLPLLPGLDPEGAYLTWTVRLHTMATEAAIREVFEFVDGDMDLTFSLEVEAAFPQPSSASTPVEAPASIVTDAEVMELIRAAQRSIQAVPAPQADPQATPQAGPPAPAKPRADEQSTAAKPTIRVDLERVDRLIDLVGELVINQAMLTQRVHELGITRSSDVAVGLDDLEVLTRDIQDSVMAIRAQPVRSVFQRMPRLTREVAAMTGKQVRLVTEGEATEVDRTVIEHLADPLIHMIRNAIDHGLERPEVRKAAGKPAEGVVRLAALHRSGRIVIEVADDGAGIDRARVRASAVAKGLVPADAVLSDDEVDNLIFLPGFSTAETVSDISGRGVGMDVVRRQVQTLGGRVSIASHPGKGSCFTLSLPLTLAVLDGMVVQVAGHTLIVPLTAIVETLQPRLQDMHGFGDRAADRAARVVAVRGAWLPLIDVAVALGFRDAPTGDPGAVAVLVETEGGRRAALLVDGIVGQRQVVIKSLEANYRHVPGVAAATILGDGRVALILDVDAVAAVNALHPNEAGLAYV